MKTMYCHRHSADDDAEFRFWVKVVNLNPEQCATQQDAKNVLVLAGPGGKTTANWTLYALDKTVLNRSDFCCTFSKSL